MKYFNLNTWRFFSVVLETHIKTLLFSILGLLISIQVVVKCDLITSSCTIASVSMITIIEYTVAVWLAVLTIGWVRAYYATVCSVVSLFTGWSKKHYNIPYIKQIKSVFNRQINEDSKHNAVSLILSYLPSEKKWCAVKCLSKKKISMPWFASNKCLLILQSQLYHK